MVDGACLSFHSKSSGLYLHRHTVTTVSDLEAKQNARFGSARTCRVKQTTTNVLVSVETQRISFVVLQDSLAGLFVRAYLL